MGFVPGGWELLVIFGVVVLLFGAKKLPALGGAVGESIKNFKKGIKDAGAAEDKPKVEEGEKAKDHSPSSSS